MIETRSVPYVKEEGANILMCPECGSEWIHLGPIRVDQDDERITVRRADTAFSRIQNPGVRGSVIELRFFCEQGHHFAFRFQFHKGMTAVETLSVPHFNEELWRD